MRTTVTLASNQPLHCAVEGALDITTVDSFERELERYLPEGATQVRVDLSRLRMIDSCGVGCLMSLALKVRARGGDVTLDGAVGQPLAILELLLGRDLVLRRRNTTPHGWTIPANPSQPLTTGTGTS